MSPYSPFLPQDHPGRQLWNLKLHLNKLDKFSEQQFLLSQNENGNTHLIGLVVRISSCNVYKLPNKVHGIYWELSLPFNFTALCF